MRLRPSFGMLPTVLGVLMARTALGLGILLALALTTGCESAGDESQGNGVVTDGYYYFTGSVYDGASRARLVKYNLEVQYMDQVVKGKVDSAGRYLVGPVPPYNDFTVAIVADGYRSFLSHNPKLPGSRDGQGQGQGGSRYFDAYVFPTALTVPNTRFTVTLEGATTEPSGTLRLQPTTRSELYASDAQRLAGVGDQEWLNDEDLQFGTVTVPFTSGDVTVEGKALVYGVTYQATVYAPNAYYQPATAQFEAGVDGDRAFILQRLKGQPLQLVANSAAIGPVQDGTLTLVMNQPVGIAPPSQLGAYTKLLDSNLTIDSPDSNRNGIFNTLKPAVGTQTAERGVSIITDGNILKLTWANRGALAINDPDDPILSVTYGGLNSIVVAPTSSGASQPVTLGQLLGSKDSIKVVCY